MKPSRSVEVAHQPEVKRSKYELLEVEIHPTSASMGRSAAAAAGEALRSALHQRDSARILLATGNSQLPMFEAFGDLDGIDWSRVEVMHLDEYIGLDANHPASFRRFLRERIVEPLGIGRFHGIDGDPERTAETIADYSSLLGSGPIDLCCMGIGENGHLAFNDPPGVDFHDPQPMRLVELDEVSRRQQVGEGHFPNLASVPTHALTLTIPSLLSARRVVVVAPEERKAQAVRTALEGPIDPSCPASFLRSAEQATLYLDADSAALLERGE